MKRVLQPDPALRAENVRDDAAENIAWLRSLARSAAFHAPVARCVCRPTCGRRAPVTCARDIDGVGEARRRRRSYRLDEAAP